MKKTSVAILCICIILSTSCQKDASNSNESVTKKIMGTWMLVKYQEDTYNASNNLTYSNERNGDQSDSLVFKQDGKLYTYSDVEGNHVDDYEVLDDEHIRIELEDWKIARLTETEFHLISEVTDAATKDREVAKAYLKRR